MNSAHIINNSSTLQAGVAAFPLPRALGNGRSCPGSSLHTHLAPPGSTPAPVTLSLKAILNTQERNIEQKEQIPSRCLVRQWLHSQAVPVLTPQPNEQRWQLFMWGNSSVSLAAVYDCKPGAWVMARLQRASLETWSVRQSLPSSFWCVINSGLSAW